MGVENKVLKNISLDIKSGEFIIITGPRGSRKSTPLNLISGLENIKQGEIIVDGIELNKLTENGLADYRSNKLAFVFQAYNLLNSFNLDDNIKLVPQNGHDDKKTK